MDVEKEIQEIKERLNKLEEQSSSVELKVGRQKEVSPREFFKNSNAKGEVEVTLLFAYYLEVVRKTTPISKTELEAVFREAKYPPPEKLSDKIYQNNRKGFLMEVDGKANPKTYELSDSGLDHVENELLKKE